jgi:uncharacterized protein (TIGR02466 family)
MKITPIFTTLFCVDNLFNIDNESLKQYIFELRKEKGYNYSNRNGWQKSLNLDDPNIQILKFEINERLQKLHDLLGLKSTVIQKISTMWINLNPKYSYNVNHTHPSSFFSGVYYINAPKNSGDITFINPDILGRNMLRENAERGLFDKRTDNNMQSMRFSPSAGDLIIFNGRIEHNVSMNYTDEDRISIPFDTLIFPRDEM